MVDTPFDASIIEIQKIYLKFLISFDFKENLTLWFKIVSCYSQG